MKKLIIAGTTLALLALVPTFIVAQQMPPTLPFESVPNPLKLPPDLNFGEVAGVAVNSKGHVFVFSRGNVNGPSYMAAAAQLLEFDASGKFIREIGKNLYAWSFAHGVRIDRQDNIWAIDKGSDTIVKFNQDGHVAMVFGRKGEASHYGTAPDTPVALGRILRSAGVELNPPPATPPRHIDGVFAQPTDVAWDSDGNVYISDGYVNSRVGKANNRGEWVTSWGSYGPGDGQFNTPHGVAVSPQQEVFVGDRGNNRIQVFDTNGKFLRQFGVAGVPVPADSKPAIGLIRLPADGPRTPTGFPDALCMTPGPNPVLFAVDLEPGRLYKISLDGKVLGIYGKSGKQLGEFGWAHALACPSENEVWVGELLNWRVQKLVTAGGKNSSK
jgi:hypothetical protein